MILQKDFQIKCLKDTRKQTILEVIQILNILRGFFWEPSTMMKKQKIQNRVRKVPRWLLTYSDMATLLLCLFVLLYATGKATPREVQLILSAFNNSLGFFSGGQTLSKGRLEDLGLSLESLPSQTKGNSLSAARKRAVSIFQPEIKAKRIRITEDERGIIISLLGADFFEPGSALLNEATENILQKAAGLISSLKRFIRIEGHSSQGEESLLGRGPFDGAKERIYKNTWDLSSARAVESASFLQSQGVPPDWIQTIGYGSYRPLEDIQTGTPEAEAHNRRIDLVLLSFRSTVRKKSESRYGLPRSKIPGTETFTGTE